MRLSIVLLVLLFSYLNEQTTQNAPAKTQVEQPKSADIAKSPAQEIAPQNQVAQTKQNDQYDPRKDHLYRLYLLATIFGVFVALGGIYAIYKQTEATAESARATRDAAVATAKSAAATEKSVKLQEIPLRGWVTIEHWEAWMDKRESTIRIRFQVINPTTLPLDLRLIDLTTHIGYLGPKQPWHYSEQLADVLAPNNPYIADISGDLSDEQTAKLVEIEDNVAISILIEGRIEFSDSTRRKWEQVFERAIYFTKSDLFSLKDHDSLTPGVRELKNTLREKAITALSR